MGHTINKSISFIQDSMTPLNLLLFTGKDHFQKYNIIVKSFRHFFTTQEEIT